MKVIKNVLPLILIFFFNFMFTQTNEINLLKGNFTYLLRGKIYKSTPNYIHEELFSLQISENKAYFISEKNLKFDSLFQNEFQRTVFNGNKIDFSGKSFPKTKFKFTIVQSLENIEYFESVGMALLSYTEPTINNWKLVNESKTINTFNCQKAEVYYKGRNWVAWYTNEVPLPYGPYKFSGLPGLIIKITDQKGDYDFELIKSTPNEKLKNKFLTINVRRFSNPNTTTIEGLEEAKRNFNENIIGSLQSMDTSIIDEQRENLRNVQKQKQLDRKDENTIELSN